MPKYDSEAKKIIAQINREAKRRYASGGYTKAEKAKIKSAYQTGRVESNFTNSSRMTDHDSQGWRQERASLYKDPTNLRRSVRRYFDEADQMYRPGMRSYQVAADVQRPAAQYRSRYGQHQGESEALFRQLRGGSGGATGMTPAAEAPSPTGRAGALRELLKASVQNPGAETALTGKNIAQAILSEGAVEERKATPAQPIRASKVSVVKGGERIGTPHSGTHTLGNWQSDNAYDIGVPNGTAIRVPRDAVVEKVKGSYAGGSSRFDGYQVTLRLKDGNRIFLTHLSKASVRVGQRLRAGAVVGRSGSANGVPHLHYGVQRGGPGKYWK